ncbi:hypothetical protein K2E96_14440 [Pseudomonas sp. ERGC3:05]|nr:hypothetical protein [Pseudomonas sp. ERGC3:01]QZC96996.1 hypothetical protein K2E96_14440 [Pseudomonas sp. ERGC3:05]
MINLEMLEQKRTDEDLSKEAEYRDAVAYLQSTDWQVIAKYERKRPIPGEVQKKRKAALEVVTAEPVTET